MPKPTRTRFIWSTRPTRSEAGPCSEVEQHNELDRAMTTCPNCHVPVEDSEEYCEACGAELSPTVAASEPPLTEEAAAALQVADDLAGEEPTCPACGGELASDGYCGTCGARAPKRRDHFNEQPAEWVAGVCDRGLRHTRNEDAVAVAADAEPGSRAVLVVCDGVSSSVDSDRASLAAARAARDILVSSRSRGMGAGLSLIAAVVARLGAAADAASEAVVEVTRGSETVAAVDLAPAPSPPSCTFVAAVVDHDLLVVHHSGNERARGRAGGGRQVYRRNGLGTAGHLDHGFAGGVGRRAEAGNHRSDQ